MNARYLLAVTALLLLGSPAAAESPAPFGDLQTWKPEASWQGGAQSDSRLDRPVKFWRAGLTLREVFAGIAQQTGVKLDFSPPDDENAGVPVNLFLNEKDPPSLRALMVQLSWVTDCVFSYRGEGEKQTYSLMRTSLGEGAAVRIEKEEAKAYQEAEAAIKAMPAKLEEIKQALLLPRDDAISRYRGQDDPLLLTVLDKKRRAAAEFAAPYGSKLLDGLTVPLGPNTMSSRSLCANLAGLGDDERALLKTAFGLPDDIFEDEKALFTVGADSRGCLKVSAPYFLQTDPRAAKPGEEPHIDVLSPAEVGELTPEHEVALEGLLGETRTPEEQRQRVEGICAERSAQKDTQEKERREAGRGLSPRAEELLSNAMLPPDHEDPAPFWRVQEEVAKATGMNVAADALWEHVPWRGMTSPPGGQDSERPALHALECCTSAYLEYPRPRGSEPARWEWGDAGSFLRFRAPDRDVWRAARLPQATLNWADGLVAPYLPKRTDAGDRPTSVDMKLDAVPEQWFPVLGRLSDLHLRYGGEESYGDPKDPAIVLRVAVLRTALPYACASPGMTRVLGQLDEEQWRALKGSGLDSASFNVNQREAFTRYLDGLQFKGGTEKPAPSEARLTMRGGDIVPPAGDDHPVFGGGSQYTLLVRLLGRTSEGLAQVGAAGGGNLPTVVEVHVDLPAPDSPSGEPRAGMIGPGGG